MGIVLLGYRGSGKTTIARLLAAHFNWQMIDTDEQVIATAGQSIREIFEQHGEHTFRDLEAAAVHDALLNQQVILSLGGGAVLRESTRQRLVNSTHHRIFLRCDAPVLHDRIHADPSTAESRPSLTHLGGNLDEIKQLLATREPLYRGVMTHELNVTRLLPEAAAAAIVGIANTERALN